MKHDAATLEAVLGRKLEDDYRHYKVRSLFDLGIGGPRPKVSKLRFDDFSNSKWEDYDEDERWGR